jgi:hypothetical protein
MHSTTQNGARTMTKQHETYIIARSRDGALWLICEHGYFVDSSILD